MAKCIAFSTNFYPWLKKAGMTLNEVMAYCLINDLSSGGCKDICLTHHQLADFLGRLGERKFARRIIRGLVKKGFIETHYYGGGSANHYRLLKTPYDLFHEIAEKDPEYFSEAQIESLERDLSEGALC